MRKVRGRGGCARAPSARARAEAPADAEQVSGSAFGPVFEVDGDLGRRQHVHGRPPTSQRTVTLATRQSAQPDDPRRVEPRVDHVDVHRPVRGRVAVDDDPLDDRRAEDVGSPPGDDRPGPRPARWIQAGGGDDGAPPRGGREPCWRILSWFAKRTLVRVPCSGTLTNERARPVQRPGRASGSSGRSRGRRPRRSRAGRRSPRASTR